MSLIVQKYGGSSVADAESIKRVAQRIVDTHNEGNQVVVVVSAMGDTTDELLDLAAEITHNPPARELDMLLTSGERISMSLVAMAIEQLGANAQSFTGSQAGLHTDGEHGKAQLVEVNPQRIQKSIDHDNIAIVAGFQGQNVATQEITTLGRGGSDTTAVALAAALGADSCEIYTDVDGVYTADPRVVPNASKIDHITSEEMLDMAANGAKVLHLRSVEYARRFGVPLHVRSSFSPQEGTWVMPGEPKNTMTIDQAIKGGVSLEQAIISGVAHDRGEAKVTVVGVEDTPGKAAEIFGLLAEKNTNVDMIVQNISTAGDHRTDISFTLPQSQGQSALDALDAAKDSIGFEKVQYHEHIGKLSLIGAGMRSNPGVSHKFFKALSDADVNIDLISTSEIRISVVTDADKLDDAIRAIHNAFELGSTEEATVYGGTGR